MDYDLRNPDLQLFATCDLGQVFVFPLALVILIAAQNGLKGIVERLIKTGGRFRIGDQRMFVTSQDCILRAGIYQDVVMIFFSTTRDDPFLSYSTQICLLWDSTCWALR